MNRNARVGMWLGLCGLGLGLWLWRNEGRQAATPGGPPVAEASRPAPGPQASAKPAVKRIETSDLGRKAAGVAEELKHRLSNTSQSESNLLRSDRALLLKNALIDTARPLDDLHIPEALRAPAGGGTYVVQARGTVGAEFQALLAGANATVVSYIPNNAELVRVSAAGAQQLAAASGLVQGVVPWAPYFKLTDPGLLQVAVEDNGQLPENVGLTLGVYNDALSNTLALLLPMKVAVVGQQPGPSGITILQVHPAPGSFLDVARLDGVMVVEATHQRTSANDLTRVRLGAAVNSSTNVDYLGLSGSNVVLNLNDTGVDTGHPDLAGRIILAPNTSGTDPNGHGTHTAGTILGNGSQSATVGLNAQGSATNALFSGLATNAQAYVIGLNMEIGQGAISGGPVVSDAYLQETAGRQTNVFISANPWAYGGSAEYDLAAASYDAAVRDAVPEVTGPQALLYVFAAGNGGGGASDGTGGLADTIRSPGTGKNVITVGAIEQQRNLTNAVVIGGVTNKNYFAPQTDSSNQVASFSSRGNVGVGVEGLAGRFKPDVVAPGTFVLSTKPVGSNWDQAGYYNPSNFTYNTQFEQVVQDTNLAAYSLFVPPRAVQVVITIQTNQFSPVPFPTNLPIYVRQVDNPTTNTFDFVSSNNMISLPPDLALDPGATFFFSVGLGTNTGVVDFDLQTLVVTTNDNGNELTVQSNLNSALGPYYRYESGTSMAAAGVSGMLALIQEFLEQRLHVTNHSPALMKALLINGARTVSSQYDLEVATAENNQGWGLPNLANSIPGALTNLAATSLPVQFFDMTGTNALATGQSVTRNLRLATRSQPLRITLVWTDPAGNPAAGVKLVNDLDLLVTNLDTGEIFWGNDIPAGSDFSESWDTNSPPMNDLVNNVENVYLRPSLSTNYSVTVYARRVNVNAVTGNTNNVVQDYALVVSYGDGGTTTNAFTVSSTNAPPPAPFPLARLTSGIPLLAQRVGANSQYSGTTNGVTNQWNFYVFTNTLAMTNNAFTNVAIVALGTANPGLPRMGASAEVGPPNNQATRSAGPDLDLYVSFDPTLTNLNAGAIAGAFKSVTRTGVEKVLFTNSTAGQVYYIGVKSEDQQAAEYQFLAVATTNGFGQTDSNGNIVLTVLTPPLPAPIPPGSPAKPGSVTLWALTTTQAQARKVVVEDTITHQNFGDLVGGFSHGQKVVVLNNHSFFVNPGDATETFVYDDTGENDPEFPNARHTDGPGSLENFIGDHAEEGLWILSMVNDSSVFDVGSVDNLTALIVPKTDNSGFQATVAPESWHYDFIDVPANATNLTVTDVASAQEFLYLRRGAIPDQTHYDAFTYVPPLVGTNLSISIYDSPPLNPGRYYIGVFNPNAVPVTNNVSWTLQFAPAAAQPLKVVSAGNEPILDDAVTYSTNHVGANSAVDGVEVGVRINHPRESDLVLTLVSPSGKRVLLAENRGGLDTNGYGSGVNMTNVAPQANSGMALANTNVLPVPSNSGTLLINYQFFTQPDDMRIYYDGVRIFDTGLINGTGTLSVDFGPGASTSVTIIMNEPGSNPGAGTNDLWNYTVTEITQSTTYAVFTENTNLTTLPIKFAPPPFGAAPGFTPPVTNLLSGFDSLAPGDYTNTLGEGWATTDTNPVKVVAVTALADTGTNVLALHFGGIQQTLNTTAGVNYTLSFAYHGRPTNGPISWWKGDGNTIDSADGNNGIPVNGPTTNAPGLVGTSFGFNGVNQYVDVANSANLNQPSNFSLEAWIYLTANVNAVPAIIISKWGDSGVWANNRSYALHLTPNNAVQFSISDFANQGNPAFHICTSANNVIPLNTWTHVAGVYEPATGTRRIYVNGANIFSRTQPQITIYNGIADLSIGSWMESPTVVNSFFPGNIDEASYYGQSLSITNIQDIYAAGSAGKNVDPVGPPVRASVSIAGVTNATIAGVDGWTTNIYTFTAPSNGTVLTIQGLDNGMLVDSFKLVQSPVPNPANYYLPEESLDKLVGDNAQGDWKLEVLDNRAGATNPAPILVSWELSLVLDRVVPAAIPLAGFVPNTNTVLAGDIRYYLVDVPTWAMHATNLLFNTSGPVNLLFNQGQLPGTNATDVTLLTAVNPSNNVTLTISNTVPLLQPGRRYYLGVQNLGAAPVNFTIEVDFDIIPLTNMIPYTNTLAATTLPQYYLYDVSSNAFAVAFEILHPTANTTLVARRGAPVPDELGFDYRSARPGTNNESIVVSTNSTPVVLLTPGRWFLGVFNDDTSAATYAIRATEAGPPTIIILTNDVPYVMTNYPPGPALNLFFEFDVTNAPPGILFELYQLTGDVDLTLDRALPGATNLPYAAPFFASSTNTGTNGEQIVVRTNNVLTNLNSSWFLGVPNNASSNVNFTIHAVVTTNGLLISAIPDDPVVTLPGGGGTATTGPTLTWPSVDGETYEVQESPNLLPGSWVTIATIVASGPTTTFTDPNAILGPPPPPSKYYRIVQIP